MAGIFKFSTLFSFQAAGIFVILVGWVVLIGHSQPTQPSPELRRSGPMPDQIWKLAHGQEAYRPLETDVFYPKVRPYLNPWASFLIRRIAYGGKLVYGDALTRYCQGVAQSLFKSLAYPAPGIRCYLLAESTPDAFALSNGMVFIHTGLIARLDNEAQLAFVLAHEWAHIRLGHLHQSMVETLDPQTWNNETRTPDIHHSPQWEKAADSLALGLYLQAGYPAEEAYRAHQISQELWHEADFSWPLHTPAPQVSAPAEITLPEFWRPFAPNAQNDYSTPSIPAQLKSLARQSVATCLLRDQQYIALLGWLEAHPETANRETYNAYAWYCLLRYQWAGKWWEVVSPGAQQPAALAALPETLLTWDQQTWNNTAGAAIRAAHLQHPENELIPALAKDLMDQATLAEWEKMTFWLTWLPDIALPDLYPEQQATLRFEIAREDRQGTDAKKFRKGFALGITHLLVADPTYLTIDLRKETGVQFRESIRKENLLSELISHSGDQLGMEITVLSASHHSPYDLSMLEEIVVIHDWLDARWRFGELDIIPCNEFEKQIILKKYGAAGLLSTGVYAQTDAHRLPAYHIALGIIVPPYLPWAMYFSLSPDQKIIFDAAVYSPDYQSPWVSYQRTMRIPDFDDLSESFIYDLLLQIQRQP